MLEVIRSETFAKWFDRLDRRARDRVQVRIDRLAAGNAGDVKPVSRGVSEMRIDFGPGYRVYFLQRGQVLVVLLAGGTKDTQDADIRKAIEIATDWRK